MNKIMFVQSIRLINRKRLYSGAISKKITHNFVPNFKLIGKVNPKYSIAELEKEHQRREQAALARGRIPERIAQTPERGAGFANPFDQVEQFPSRAAEPI